MFEIESNDTILLANFIEIGDIPEIITGEIDDNEDDVDLFAVELNAGETLLADINIATTDSELDAVLSIFDADGNLLVQNDDNSFELDGEIVIETDSFQQFVPIQDGTYFVGVSSSENLDYDPTVAGSGSGNSSGSYSLALSIEEFTSDELSAESNDIISAANPIELDREEFVTLSGQIGDNTTSILLSEEDDVDLYEVELEEGDVIVADINAAIIGSDLNAVLSIFDINGELLAQNDDNSFENEDGETITELDPFSQLSAPEDGTYYIGVSSFGNSEYDPNLTISRGGSGETVGFYNLVLSFGEEILGEEILGEEIPTEEIADDDSSSGGIGDRILDDDIDNDGSLTDIITDRLDDTSIDSGLTGLIR